MTLKYIFKYLKKCAFSAKIRDFGFDARSIPVVAELSNFNTCVFSPIGTFFAVMQNFSKKNVISSHPTLHSPIKAFTQYILIKVYYDFLAMTLYYFSSKENKCILFLFLTN